MKAYKQIDYKLENRIVFGCAGLMSLLSFLILLSPVIAQDTINSKKKQPDIHYDIKKEFDKDGNLIVYDSSFSWFWSGKGFNRHDFDSLLKQFHQQSEFFDYKWGWSGLTPFPEWPDNSHIRFWNKLDTTDYNRGDSSIYHDFFNHPGFEIFPYSYNHRDYFDSLIIPFSQFEDISKLLNHEFDIDQFLRDDKKLQEYMDRQDEFFERYREYQKEHQKLIERYFYDTDPDNTPTPPNQPQKLKSPVIPNDYIRTGRV